MKNIDTEVFIQLFKEAYYKCFGLSLLNPLSESESTYFSNKILEETGLVIGSKSLKNYASCILKNEERSFVNPSVATLDTLARYVLKAPHADERQRKQATNSYTYWFQYKNGFLFPENTRQASDGENAISNKSKSGIKKIKAGLFILTATLLILSVILLLKLFWHAGHKAIFIENFHSVREDSLVSQGWFIRSKDSLWWSLRGEDKNHLTLFTLRGDNWADSSDSPDIQNLLIRRIPFDDFTTETLIDDFMPKHDWQQAGILLLEDTDFDGKSLRLSVAYNDFFGGYQRPPQIIIQGINSGKYDKRRPEEIVHLPLYNLSPSQVKLVKNNLQHIGLKIEKNGRHFRLLYETGPFENAAFKEAFSGDLDINPHYIGLFALEGFVKDTSYAPVHFRYFSLINNR